MLSGCSWPSGAQAALRVGPSLSALRSSLRIGQIEEEWLKHPPHAALDLIDKQP
ncbi:hypothetical protein D3C86_1001170 [compost metagenome]